MHGQASEAKAVMQGQGRTFPRLTPTKLALRPGARIGRVTKFGLFVMLCCTRTSGHNMITLCICRLQLDLVPKWVLLNWLTWFGWLSEYYLAGPDLTPAEL